MIPTSDEDAVPQLHPEPESLELWSEHLTFAPLYPPGPGTWRKDRDLTRQKGMCDGEDVEDGGGTNRELHITGTMRNRERHIFEAVMDADHPFYVFTSGWTGWCRVSTAEYKGPTGSDPNGGMHWKYTLDLVSTGKSEYADDHGSGIVK